MAADYIEAIRKVQSHGPYFLVGECFGGVAAYEAALRGGRGAVLHKGRMLDKPVVDQAEAVLARQRAIEGRR